MTFGPLARNFWTASARPVLAQAQLKGGRQSLPDFECHVHREPWGLIGRFTQTAANCVTEAMPRAGIVTRTGLAELRRLELDKANLSMGLAAQPPEPSHSPVATGEEAKKTSATSSLRARRNS